MVIRALSFCSFDKKYVKRLIKNQFMSFVTDWVSQGNRNEGAEEAFRYYTNKMRYKDTIKLCKKTLKTCRKASYEV